MTAARKQTDPFFSPEEYLEHETLAAEKHEYYNGEIVPMAGASINHNRIVRNIVVALSIAFKAAAYEVFSTDLRLWVPARNTYTYPDVLVVAGPPLHHDERSDTVTNPVMLLEVLSDTTSHYDRGEKFVGYRTLPSLRDYLLVDQSRCLVEQFARVEQNKWLLTEYHEMEQVVELSFEPIRLALRDIYERVEFPLPPEHPPETASESKQPEGEPKS
jgi:Uma2 family endonuclease